MTEIVYPPELAFRMEAYPIDRNVITAPATFNRAMDLCLSLVAADNAKDLARKLKIDPGAFSCKLSGTKPWGQDEIDRAMRAGQNLIPLAWWAARYGHGLVMLETEAERRERAMRETMAAQAEKIEYLEQLVSGRTP